MLALVSWLLTGSAVAPAAGPPPDRLLGVWQGTMTTVQAGTCTHHGGPQPVKLVVRRGGDGRVRAALTWLSAAADTDDGTEVVVSDQKVRFEQPARASCGEVHNAYTIKYEGGWPSEVAGTRTLHLEGRNSPCHGCRFRQVLDLEWKRMPVEYTLGVR